MKFVNLAILFVLLTFTVSALDIELNQRYDSEGVVPFNGTCNESNVPVAFQVSMGVDRVWLDQNSTDDDSFFKNIFNPVDRGNYTLYVACSGENEQKDFCVGGDEECGLSSLGATLGTTTCSLSQCQRSWPRLNDGDIDTLDTENQLDITEIEFTVTENVGGTPSLTVKEIQDLPVDILKFTKEAYSKFEVKPNPVFAVDNVTVSFRAEKSWTESSGVGKPAVRLYRYNNDWIPLDTTFRRQADWKGKTYYYYEAESPGLSYFIVGGEQTVAFESCIDGVRNQQETAIDCGGPNCPACLPAATCNDGVRNQGETAIDCGGLNCPACVKPAATCSDRIRNQGEQGIDCGGPCVNACASCTDNILNQGEQGIDCGGPCSQCEEEVSFFADPIILGSIGAIVLLLIILVVFFMMKKKGGKHIGELKRYVQSQLSAGHSMAEIKSAVKGTGWSEKDMKKVFK
ncbi:MAG: hypothetical protein CMH61_00435 [Nanoarchaeota archaeon]|nr:hypothetical protein [Nanoarchaeota archaeon]